MDAKSYNEFCACLKSYLQCVAKLLWLQCSRLVATVRENFIPEAGSSGIRALGSRFVNLWGCGGYGKAAIVIALIFCFSVFKIMCSDDGLLVPQTGRYPKEWYDKFEEEPYGVIGFKGLSPAGRGRDGILVFRSIPALSEVQSAFRVDPCYGFGFSNPSCVYYFPPASDRSGRIAACQDYQQRNEDMQKAADARLAQRRLSDMMFNLKMQSTDADIAADSRRFNYRNKLHAAYDRQQDYDMARGMGMSLKRYDTYKRTPDAISMDQNGVYSGSDGNTYQIDRNGMKWWLYNGNRVPVK